MFADKVEISVQAGKGGDGKMSFRHEKYRALGGPDGGDGGRGGSVIFRVDHNMSTLSSYRTQRLIKADQGEPGRGNRSHGKNGQDSIVRVPPGTMVYEQVSTNGPKREKGDSPIEPEKFLIADLTEEDEECEVAKGGRGGFGNAHFVSSSRQAPRISEAGEPGDAKKLTLELKLVADVGLVGLPNAGKSTLLSVISNAKPQIGDYPFTTLIPNLGVVDIDEDTFLVADIPGLIEGASQGKGLGDEFLRHVERTAVLLHLIDVNSDDVLRDYETIQKELKSYMVDLTSKPQFVVLTKAEGIALTNFKDIVRSLTQGYKGEFEPADLVIAISAQAHINLDQLLRKTAEYIRQARAKRAEEVEEESIPVINEASQPDLWTIEPDGDVLVVSGQKIEGFARRTKWGDEDSLGRLRDIMRKIGIDKEIRRQRKTEKQIIRIAGHEFEWRG